MHCKVDIRNMVHLYRGDIYLAPLSELNMHHNTFDVEIIPSHEDAESSIITCAMFAHPSKAGYLWFRTDKVFEALKLMASKMPSLSWNAFAKT